MRSSLSTLLGASVAFGIAFAPVPAVADTVTQRVDLGQQQTTTQQIRWQPTARSEVATQPWTLVSSSQRVERTPTRGGRTQDQKFKTDVWQQQITQYPLEAKQVQDQTTTTRNYELRTYQTVTTTSTVSVPGTQEVGDWTTQTTRVPETITVQTPVNRPVLVPKEVPVYKTVTSTYSQPILTPLQTTKTVYQSQQVTETRYKDVTTKTQTLYSGAMYDRATGQYVGTVVMDSDGSGLSLNCPGHLNTHMTYWTKVWTDAINYGELRYADPWLDGKATVRDAGDHDELDFQADHKYAGWVNWWNTTMHVRLGGHLIGSITTTQSVPYTVTVTKQVPVTVPVNFSVQLDHVTNTPKDLCGTDPTKGVYWKEYHYKGTSCPYQAVKAITKIVSVYIPHYGYAYATQTNTSELDTAKAKAVTVSSAADRIAGLNADDQSAFTLEYHHTDVLPQFADDAQVLSKSEQVFDHNDVQMVWENHTVWITEQVPVTQQVGETAQGIPIYKPVMKTVETQVWATHSIPVTEVKTVTSTSSVLVSSVPGVETSVSTGPWLDTGETRRGTGLVSTLSRSTDNLLATWIEPSPEVPAAVATSNRSNTSVYMSDFRSGVSAGSKQSLVGASVRRLLNSSKTVATQAKQTTEQTHQTRGQDWDNQLSGMSEVSQAMVSAGAQLRALIEQREKKDKGHEHNNSDH